MSNGNVLSFESGASKENLELLIEGLRKVPDMSHRDAGRFLKMTRRNASKYMNHLYEKEKVYITRYEDPPNGKGSKTAYYALKKTGQEQDAPRWWLEVDDSEGGHHD